VGVGVPLEVRAMTAKVGEGDRSGRGGSRRNEPGGQSGGDWSRGDRRG
jgi:hypothetical protein